ncbi:hypothetical protein GCM10027073_63330 [Streptomyces chlorus]
MPPVDRQQRAVQDHERLGGGDLHRLGERRGEGGQDVDGLGDVPVRGGGAYAEPGSELGVGVTAAQMGQHQQCLSSGGQATPSRALSTATCRQFSGEEAQG